MVVRLANRPSSMKRFVTILNRSHSGLALAMSIIFLTAIAIIIVALLARTSFHTQTTRYQISSQAATQAAESGIEKAVYCLNNPTNTTDCSSNPNYTGESNLTVGNATVTMTVS